MDHHKHVEGLTADAVADAHRKDVDIQGEYGVKYHGTGSTKVRARSSASWRAPTKRLPKPFTGRPTGCWLTS